MWMSTAEMAVKGLEAMGPAADWVVALIAGYPGTCMWELVQSGGLV